MTLKVETGDDIVFIGDVESPHYGKVFTVLYEMNGVVSCGDFEGNKFGYVYIRKFLLEEIQLVNRKNIKTKFEDFYDGEDF